MINFCHDHCPFHSYCPVRASR